MKKLGFLFALVALPFMLLAQNPDGLACENAIPVDGTYTGAISAPGVYYFTAWTYDLPLTCYFYPENGADTELYMDVDFTCTPGVYVDPNVQELVDETMGWGIDMPIRFDNFNEGKDQNGKRYYSMSVEEIYRDLMSNFGITYNVQAFVKVVTSSAGSITMSPDLTFRNCVESSKWVELNDTLPISFLNDDKVFVLPLPDWKNDSVRFVWSGKSPVQLWIGDDCDFELKLTGENKALKNYEIYPNAGNNENVLVLTRQDIADLINLVYNGGYAYVRFVSAEDATLIVEKQPISGPMADAIRLEFNQAAPVNANDLNQVYYFPASWKVRDLLLTSDKKTAMTAYFYGDVELTKPLGAYDFNTVDNQTSLGISVKELETLLKDFTEEYVFVVFNAAHNTAVTPSKWEVCPCVQTTTRVELDDTVALKARTTVNYRINYNTWSKNNVTIKWSAKNKMKLAVADTCAGFELEEIDPRVLLYKLYENSLSKQLDSIVITGEQIRTWADYVDENGFLYLRCNANVAGSLIISYEPDQTIIPTSPCVAASTELLLNSQETISLNNAFSIYRINYAEWAANGATLKWSGAEILHTFVAETCNFAVAPYNKYVHVYVPVQGEHTLDAAAMADLAEFVDEDGYLYIRFLTEKEGILEVK